MADPIPPGTAHGKGGSPRARSSLSGAEARNDRLSFALCALCCLALLLCAYAGFFRNAFHFDDSHVVVNNVYIRSLANIPLFFKDARTFSSQPRNATYRPLVSVSLAIDYWLGGGLSPVVFHGSQLAMLALFGAALAWFYWRVMQWCLPWSWNRYLALFGATLFCVHTVNSETMNLMHARSEIQSALGIVLGFLCYFRGGWIRRWLLYLVPVALGALAKLPALIFAPLLFVWVFLESIIGGDRKRIPGALKSAAMASAPSFLMGVFLYWFIERAMRAPEVTMGGGNRLHYALTQPWVWLQYLRMFFFPVGLTADTDLGLFTTWTDPRLFAALAAIALLAGIAWVCARSRTAWPVTFGLVWFALGLMPTSSILPLAEPINEHRVFLPYIGLILAIVWGGRLAGGALVRRSGASAAAVVGAAAVLCSLILIGHAAGTYLRNQTWRTDKSLWADVTRKSPGNGRGWMNYGLALMGEGNYKEAKACFDRALPLTPNYSTLAVNMGVLAGAMGNQKEAEAQFQRALRLDTGQPSSHYYYARWMVKQGRAPEAIPHLEETIRLSPAIEDARGLLLSLRAAQGDEPALRRAAQDYLAIWPENAVARAYLAGRTPAQTAGGSYESCFRRGLELGKEESFVDSALQYREALKLNPDSADALSNLGWTLSKLGFNKEAIPYLERALQLRPDFQLARNNLAWAKSQLGQRQK